MARGDLLFSTNDLWSALQAHERNARESIDRADPNKFPAISNSGSGWNGLAEAGTLAIAGLRRTLGAE